MTIRVRIVGAGGSSPIATDLAGGGRIERPRTLTAETAGHTVSAEFDSFEASDKARPRFATLVPRSNGCSRIRVND